MTIDVVLGQHVGRGGPRGRRGRSAASAPTANGEATAETLALRQHRHVGDPERRQARDRAAGGGAEADHRGAQAPAVVARRADQLQRVQHRAVARQLVVLVEHVDAEVALAGPVVHRLEGDQRELAVDRQLRHPRVLDAVRPAPHDLAGAQRLEIVGQRLGQQDDVALGEQLARASAARRRAAPAARRRRRSARRSRARRTCGRAARGRCARSARDGSPAGARPACAMSRRRPGSANPPGESRGGSGVGRQHEAQRGGRRAVAGARTVQPVLRRRVDRALPACRRAP